MDRLYSKVQDPSNRLYLKTYKTNLFNMTEWFNKTWVQGFEGTNISHSELSNNGGIITLSCTTNGNVDCYFGNATKSFNVNTEFTFPCKPNTQYYFGGYCSMSKPDILERMSIYLGYLKSDGTWLNDQGAVRLSKQDYISGNGYIGGIITSPAGCERFSVRMGAVSTAAEVFDFSFFDMIVVEGNIAQKYVPFGTKTRPYLKVRA